MAARVRGRTVIIIIVVVIAPWYVVILVVSWVHRQDIEPILAARANSG